MWCHWEHGAGWALGGTEGERPVPQQVGGGWEEDQGMCPGCVQEAVRTAFVVCSDTQRAAEEYMDQQEMGIKYIDGERGIPLGFPLCSLPLGSLPSAPLSLIKSCLHGILLLLPLRFL